MDPSQRLALELSYEAMESGASSQSSPRCPVHQELTLGNSWRADGINGWFSDRMLYGDMPARLRQYAC